MSRRKRKNKKNNKALQGVVEKQVDNLKEQIKEIVPKAPVEKVSPQQTQPKQAPQWPSTVQQILDTGDYEIVGNILKKKGTDVGFTLSSTFINSLDNPKTLASFLNPAPQSEKLPEPEPEPEKHDAFYYQMEDKNSLKDFKFWLEKQPEPIALSEDKAKQALEYLDTVEFFLHAMRKQLDEGNDLTKRGAECLAINLDTCLSLKMLFSDFLYEDD